MEVGSGVMNGIVEDKRNEVARLCVTRRVARLELFGSAAKAASRDEPNDLDFLVEFEAMSPTEHADCFFGLQADLEGLFAMPVDLLEPGPIRNPYLWQAIERTRVLVYAAA